MTTGSRSGRQQRILYSQLSLDALPPTRLLLLRFFRNLTAVPLATRNNIDFPWAPWDAVSRARHPALESVRRLGSSEANRKLYRYIHGIMTNRDSTHRQYNFASLPWRSSPSAVQGILERRGYIFSRRQMDGSLHFTGLVRQGPATVGTYFSRHLELNRVAVEIDATPHTDDDSSEHDRTLFLSILDELTAKHGNPTVLGPGCDLSAFYRPVTLAVEDYLLADWKSGDQDRFQLSLYVWLGVISLDYSFLDGYTSIKWREGDL